MLHGGHGDGGGSEVGLGVEERGYGWIGGDGEFCSKRSGAERIGIDEGGEVEVGVSGGKLAPDTEMIFAEGSAAEDGNPDWR